MNTQNPVEQVQRLQWTVRTLWATLVLTFVLMVVAGVSNKVAWLAHKQLKQEVIDRGYAKYIADPRTGAVQFVWKQVKQGNTNASPRITDRDD